MTRFHRGSALAELDGGRFDVLVVGGGITGAGVALDASSRGLRTALVDKGDFASGTSSRSSKLVHGGLRYLSQGDYPLVREGLVERQRALDNAPHLVRPLPFLIPVYGGRSKTGALSSALWAYDVIGGFRTGRRHRRISAQRALQLMPTLRREGLAAAFVYQDAHADDARLTLAVLRTAVLDHGALAANYLPVTSLLRRDGRVVGARCGALDVSAKVVVNATGVWADEVRALADPGEEPAIRPAKGVHVTVAGDKVGTEVAAVLPVPADGRSIFVIPWEDRVYIGTTDTDYDGPLDDPHCTDDDVTYLLDAANAFLTCPLSPSDVLGTWAGLRPLVAHGPRGSRSAGSRTTDLSRRHVVARSAGGVITVTGGKLTTYRKMAADTVDEVVATLGRRDKCRTASLKLRGAEGSEALADAAAPGRLGLPSATLEHLRRRYGGEARTVAAMLAREPSLAEPLVPTLPYLRAEALYAARYEMAHTVDDVLCRRTRASVLASGAAAAAAPHVARLLAPELGWSAAEADRQAAACQAGGVVASGAVRSP